MYRNRRQIFEFVKKIIENNMGNILDYSSEKKQAIQFTQGIKIQKGIEFLTNKKDRTIGEEILNYLSEVNIYLNGSCKLDCDSCSYGYKQTFTCKRTNPKSELKVEDVKNLIDLFSGIPINTLHISGGDIFRYNGLEDILLYLQNKKFQTVLYVNSVLFFRNWHYLINKNIFINIIINNIDNIEISELQNILEKNFINYIITFFINSEDQLKKLDLITMKLDASRIDLKAIYNHKNFDFFEENVFIDKKMLFKDKYSLNEINRKQSINYNFFGKLTINNDGMIYSNINGIPLGNIRLTTLQEAIYKELDKNQFWRLLRKNVLPCSGCYNNSICPDISNYEIILGKYNLCQSN
jgi:pseudo-rSAM protein